VPIKPRGEGWLLPIVVALPGAAVVAAAWWMARTGGCCGKGGGSGARRPKDGAADAVEEVVVVEDAPAEDLSKLSIRERLHALAAELTAPEPR